MPVSVTAAVPAHLVSSQLVIPASWQMTDGSLPTSFSCAPLAPFPLRGSVGVGDRGVRLLFRDGGRLYACHYGDTSRGVEVYTPTFERSALRFRVPMMLFHGINMTAPLANVAATSSASNRQVRT